MEVKSKLHSRSLEPAEFYTCLSKNVLSPWSRVLEKLITTHLIPHFFEDDTNKSE